MCWDNPQRSSQSPSVSPAGSVDVSQLPSLVPGYSVQQRMAVHQGQLSAWSHPPQLEPFSENCASLFQLPHQQHPGLHHFAHFLSLEQPLQRPTPCSGRASRSNPTTHDDEASQEPSRKRLAIDLNCALANADESEDRTEVAQDRTEDLPDECLAQIFSLLDDVKDRMSSAFVCRRWLHVMALSRKRRPSDAPPSHEHGKDATGQAAPTGSGYKARVSEAAEVVTGLARTVEGRSASDARLMSMAIALADKGGLEKLVVRGSRRGLDTAAAAAAAQPGPVPVPVPVLPLTASGFQAIAMASPNLRSLAIWDCDWLDDEAVLVVARLCRRLEKLDIMNCPRLSDKSLTTLARFCPHLSVISLTRCCMVTDAGMQALAKGCKGLTSLSLTDCPHVMGKGVGVLASTCKRLTSIKLAGAMGLTEEGFRFIGDSAASLTRLRLYQLKNLSEEGFKCLGETKGFRKLTSLSVAVCHGLTPAALDTIGRSCTALKSLALVGCANVTDRGLLSLLQHSQSLEALTLQMLPGITNEAARSSLEFGKHLRTLTISSCSEVKDTAVGAAEWAIKCPDLISLKVANCRAIGDGCLSSMGRAGSSLSSLDLCSLPLAGDKGMLAFLESSSKKLNSIDFSGCGQVTDKAVAFIADRCGESLRSLCLDGCTRVTDKGLRALAKTCTAIEDLDLSKCDITDRGLKTLLAAVGPSLVNLSLAGCVRITDRSVEEIMDTCHSLSGLNLKNCSGLSKRAVERLRHQAVNLFGPTCLFIDP